MNIDIDIEKLNLKERDLEMFNLFVDFLVEKGAYSNYLKEVHKQTGTKIDKIIEDICRRKDLGSIITRTLTWHKTGQGEEYWAELHIEWKNYFTRVLSPSSL